MAQRKFSIGIDLGTSNSVLAYAPLDGRTATEVLPVRQWETPTTVTEAATLPSFLYHPEEAVAANYRELGAGDWIVGSLAQRKASETPGRVVKSAKSWLCHSGADRTAAFLPWGSDALPEFDKISPVAASAFILGHLRAAWNASPVGLSAPFEEQEVTVTVPASFDAAAQKLTLDAAAQAGFPNAVRLLEEPQAAFYAWLEGQGTLGEAGHVLVVDVGGGTSDFSLFEIAAGKGEPSIKRVAVSDHILLGGDNIDLAIAHLFEGRLGGAGGLSASQWDHLIARCRALKEKALGSEGPPEETFSISIPARGSSVFAGSLSAQATRAEIETLLLDGFFPECKLTDAPRRALGAIKEFGLPYAFDGAITRHLAAFLNGRPAVDAVLFNGGSLHPARLRERLCEQIGKWQDGRRPRVLANDHPDLAVACGAAYAALHARRIEAGAARAVFLEAVGKEGRSLVCILPHGAAPGETFETGDLSLRIDRLVRFQVYTSTRHETTRVGDVVDLAPDEFHALPPLESVATVARTMREPASSIPIGLSAKENELGLLQVACRSLAPEIRQSWPLEFNLRPTERRRVAQAPTSSEPPVAPAALDAARARLNGLFAKAAAKRDKVSAPRVLQGLEEALKRPRAEWGGLLLRELWECLRANAGGRAVSVEHEEVWLILAGYFLRPGFGVALDDERIDALWRIVGGGLKFPGKRGKLQEYILWRRVAGGLTGERQESLVAAEGEKLFAKNAPGELIRMAGAFERLSQETKGTLVTRFLETTAELAAQKKHCAPYPVALGLLLNRTPFYAGAESIVAPSLVESAYEALRKLDWADPELAETQTLFLRAARAVEDRRLDVPKSTRNAIADKLQKCGVASVKVDRVRQFAPVERAERMSLYGEALPAGLILDE